MSNNNLFRIFYGKIVIVLTVLALQSCASVHTNNMADYALPEMKNISYTQKTVQVIMIDGVLYHKEKVEEFVSLWNDMSKGSLQSYNEQFGKEFNAYMIFLGSLSVMPAPQMAANNAFLKRFSDLTEELVFNLYFTKSRIRAELENYVIGKNTPYEINSVYNFDDLFQSFQVISVNGNMSPVLVFNIIQESMVEVSKKQQLYLFNELEKAYTNIYLIRRNNSKEFANWVNGWINYFTRSGKELIGTWDKNYAAQYDKLINNGIDTGLPERLVIQAKNRAEILLYGYINILAHSIINDSNSDVILVFQEIDYEQFFIPYTLLQYTFYAGEIVGIDTSDWRRETNNRIMGRIMGGVTIGFNIADIVVFVASKCHPVLLVIDLAIRTGDAVLHICTKKGKVAKLEEEIKVSLDDELNQLLSVLREPLKNDVLLGKADE